MRKLSVLVVSVVVIAAACSSSRGFDEQDLAVVVLQLGEAPDDMQFVASQSGPFSIEELTTDETEIARLEGDGFIAAFDAIFASPGLAGVEGDISRSGARLVDSSAFVFASIQGAVSSFSQLETDVPGSFSELGTITPVVADDLGDEAFAVRVDFFNGALGPDVGVLYSWRVENLILRLVMWGEMVNEITDVRPIVDIMDSHTI